MFVPVEGGEVAGRGGGWGEGVVLVLPHTLAEQQHNAADALFPRRLTRLLSRGTMRLLTCVAAWLRVF